MAFLGAVPIQNEYYFKVTFHIITKTSTIFSEMVIEMFEASVTDMYDFCDRWFYQNFSAIRSVIPVITYHACLEQINNSV